MTTTENTTPGGEIVIARQGKEPVPDLASITSDPETVAFLMDVYDENERLVRQNERQRLAWALLDESSRFTQGAFVDGIRHAATRLSDAGFAPFDPAAEDID